MILTGAISAPNHRDINQCEKLKRITEAYTLWMVDGHKVRLCSEHDLLQNDSETVDVSFLSSVDRSSCHT